MATTAERQRSFNARMRAKGFVKISGWVHVHQAADAQIVLNNLRQDPELEVGPMKHTPSGKLRKTQCRPNNG